MFVLSSQFLGKVPQGVTPTTRGMLGALQQARLTTAKDIWVVGGAVAMQSALEEGYIDLMEIFLVPVLLGSGLTVLNDLRRHQSLVLDGSETFPDGVVKLRYLVQKPDRPAPPA